MQKLPKFSERNDGNYLHILRELETWSKKNHLMPPELDGTEVENNVKELDTAFNESPVLQTPNNVIPPTGL